MKRTEAGARKAYLAIQSMFFSLNFPQNYLPEPEDQIDLLIDDVLCQHTHPVLHPLSPRWANIWQVAGYFSGEGVTHGVPLTNSLTLSHAEVAHHIPPVPRELPAEELVRQVELDDQQDVVEKLAWTQQCFSRTQT